MAKLNKREQQRARAKAAMPDVQRLVKKHGRAAIANCLHKIQQRDREAAKLAKLKQQVNQMERGLRA